LQLDDKINFPAMEILREAPNINSFIPLSDHQSTTPASFYSGPPVLHFHSSRCKVLILERDLSLSAPLAALAPDALHAQELGANGHRLNAHTNSEDNMAEEDGQRLIEDVEVLVTSQYANMVSSDLSSFVDAAV
jgi:chloride channel, nucleotide-sensitive, 1A